MMYYTLYGELRKSLSAYEMREWIYENGYDGNLYKGVPTGTHCEREFALNWIDDLDESDFEKFEDVGDIERAFPFLTRWAWGELDRAFLEWQVQRKVEARDRGVL
jgi:hypothetical protein